jgi:trimethylguanosine synthase
MGDSADAASGMACAAPLPGVHAKHWNQRYRYFSRFDEGVRIDYEGWYSICPEACAEHVAKRVAGAGLKVVFDAFSGCGGNALALAKHCDYVVSCDIDPVKVACAKHNAKVYGVCHKIEFLVGDSSEFLLSFARRRKRLTPVDGNGMNTIAPCIFDAVCLAPPWGGPDYLASPVFDLETMLCCPLDGPGWLKAARAVAKHVVLVVPRSVQTEQFGELLGAAEALEEVVEVEDVALNYKVKLKVGYYGPRFATQRKH